MGLINWGAPENYVLALKDAMDIPCFVETGTFRGATTCWAARHFAEVYTIELSETLYKETADILGPLENVTALLGDTREELARLAPQLPKSIVWLDAHWSGLAGAAGWQDQCPLLEELEILREHWDRLFILVDDARFFLAPPGPPHEIDHWPTLPQIVNALAGPGRFVASFEDIFVSVPLAARAVTMSYVQKGGNLNERVLGLERPANSHRSVVGRAARRLAHEFGLR